MFDLIHGLMPPGFWEVAAAAGVSIAFIGGVLIVIMLVALTSQNPRKRLPR
jgi:hypothetical protein